MLPPSPLRSIRGHLCRFSAYSGYSSQIPVRCCSSKLKMGPGTNPVRSPGGSSFLPSGSNTAFGEKGLSQRGGVEQAMHSSAYRAIRSVQSESSNVQNCDREEEYPPLSVNMGCTSKGMHSGRRKTRIDLGSEQSKEDIRSPEGPELEGLLNMGCSSKGINSGRRKNRIDLQSKQRKEDDTRSSELEGLDVANIASPCEELSLPTQFGKKAAYGEKLRSGRIHVGNSASTKHFNCSEDSVKVERFFICNRKSRNFDGQSVCISSIDSQNRIKMDPTLEGIERRVLRSGMVLLKHYIALPDQIKIVETCHKLGKGPGGFYRPGYNDGAKLRLHMMCLGLNWEPQTRKYSNKHPVDCCEPPGIPNEFSLLVQRAIQDAHELIKKDLRGGNVEDTLPIMSPDICIVNFYTSNGRLGLHQDRDESRDSIRKGLPVVSFSIGDSAEFLYGNERDINKAEKVLLESGDVLIFGGESRLVFHGVPSIVPDSAPEALLAKTGMRAGRLNLTFRKF